MRSFLIIGALASCVACSRSGDSANVSNGGGAKAATTNSAAMPANRASVSPASANKAAPAKESAAIAGLPEGFPSSDEDTIAAECIVYLGLSRHANSRAVGHDGFAMNQAQDQWKSALALRMPQVEADQLVGSSVNILERNPVAQRDAASKWCVENAAEPDPEG